MCMDFANEKKKKPAGFPNWLFALLTILTQIEPRLWRYLLFQIRYKNLFVWFIRQTTAQILLEATKSHSGICRTAAIFWRVIIVVFVLPDSIRERLAFSELHSAAISCCTIPFAFLVSRILQPRFMRNFFSSCEYLFKAVVFYAIKDRLKAI